MRIPERLGDMPHRHSPVENVEKVFFPTQTSGDEGRIAPVPRFGDIIVPLQRQEWDACGFVQALYFLVVPRFAMSHIITYLRRSLVTTYENAVITWEAHTCKFVAV